MCKYSLIWLSGLKWWKPISTESLPVTPPPSSLQVSYAALKRGLLLSALASAAACCKSFSCCCDLWSLCSAWNNCAQRTDYWSRYERVSVHSLLIFKYTEMQRFIQLLITIKVSLNAILRGELLGASAPVSGGSGPPLAPFPRAAVWRVPASTDGWTPTPPGGQMMLIHPHCLITDDNNQVITRHQ